MYYRKWTRMDYWESLRIFKKYKLIDYQESNRQFHLFSFPDNEKQKRQEENERKKQKVQLDQDQILINNVLNAYPELKYEPASKLNQQTGHQQKSYLLRFIQQQKQLINSGFSEQKAFNLTEKMFHDRIQRKIESNKLTNNLAITNNARSFMNMYVQQTEYEARLKVIRMERDLSKYKKKLEELEADMKFYEEQDTQLLGIEEEMEFQQNELRGKQGGDNQQQQQQQKENINIIEEETQNLRARSKESKEEMYERVLFKIINKDVSKNISDENEQKVEENRMQRTEFVKDFVSRTKNMFKLYYERAAVNDKLSLLTDQEIKNQIRNSPKKLQHRSKQLLQKLEKFNVFLKPNGELDFSKVDNENIKKQLMQDENVKQALLLHSINFECPIQEALREKAILYRNRIQELEAQSEYLKQQSRKTDQQQEENADQEKKQFDLQEEQQNQQNQKFTSYEDKYVEQQQQQYRSNRNENKDDESLQNQKNIQKEQYLNSLDQQLFINKESYKMFETYEERIARLETKFYQFKLKELESEGQVNQEQEQILENLIGKLRRIKLRVEQKNLEKASSLIFDEHGAFEPEEITVDSLVPFEDLQAYLELPSEKRKQSEKQEIDNNLVNKMIQREEIKVDLVEPFSGDFQNLLLETDTAEFNQQKFKKELDTQKKLLKKQEELVQKEKQDQDNALLAGTEESTSKKQNINEKKRLLDFIKKSNLKKLKKGKSPTSLVKKKVNEDDKKKPSKNK